MSKGRFRGHYYSQFNHQRLMPLIAGLPSEESAAVLKLHVLAGSSRQQFDLCDGRLSVMGKPMKQSEVEAWLVQQTPGLKAPRAKTVFDSLIKLKLVFVSKAGVVKLAGWGEEQTKSPTSGAARQQVSRLNRWTNAARLSLYKENGKVLEVDDLLYRVKGAAKVGEKSAEGILKELSGTGEIKPKDGGLLVSIILTEANVCAPAARSAPCDCDGAYAREGEGDISHSASVTCHNHKNYNHKRDAYASHDHERAQARVCEYDESPGGQLRRPSGSDSVRRGAERAAGGADRDCRYVPSGSEVERFRADIFSAPATAPDLVSMACHVLNPPNRKKTAGIFGKRIRLLSEYLGDADLALVQFRRIVEEVFGDWVSNDRVRKPEMIVTAKMNEAMGCPARQAAPY
ncbi:MAG: hypothetical protein WC959_10700 [Kiritimatiellales bacterium]